jgi:hypothetical protein
MVPADVWVLSHQAVGSVIQSTSPGPAPRQLSMIRGSSTEKRTPELRRRKSPSAVGDSSCGSEEALSIIGLFDLAFELLLPRCRPFLNTPDSFFRPACRQLRPFCCACFLLFVMPQPCIRRGPRPLQQCWQPCAEKHSIRHSASFLPGADLLQSPAGCLWPPWHDLGCAARCPA